MCSMPCGGEACVSVSPVWFSTHISVQFPVGLASMCLCSSGSSKEYDMSRIEKSSSSTGVMDHLSGNETASVQPVENKVLDVIHIDEDYTTDCGLGQYSPKWLQSFASKKTYVIVYGMIGMNQSAIGSYFVGTISTIEKRFRFPSSTSGFIASSWDFGALCTVLIMTYFGSSGHKTRWIAFCALFTALSCFLRYVPFVLFGTSTGFHTSTNSPTYDICDASQDDTNCVLNSEGFITTVILTLAHITLGIGTSTYNTLGAAYLDDNSLRDKAPFLLSLATSFRQLGPTVGFLIASYALKIHESNVEPASYSFSDQRWIGSWQLGWIPLGTVHLFLALLMAFFPKMLPREARRRKLRTPVLESRPNKKWSLNGLKCKLEGLLRNPVLICNSLSSTSYMFGVIGYMVFMPKYIEAQFMQSASKANFIIGTVGLICTIAGCILSGLYISKFKPHPRSLSAWSFFTKIVDTLVHIIFAFISCKKGNFSGVFLSENRFNLISSCNEICNCTSTKYSPVCNVETQMTFFSPCHAGCKTTNIVNESVVFTDCGCLTNQGMTIEGACPTSCENHFLIFVALLCFLRFLSSTGRAGSTIIQYRSVDQEDKSLSIALSEVMLCGLAFIPAPIIYGLILDSSCLVWGQECGKKGNCVLYDEKKLRFNLNFTASGFLFLAAFFDFFVFKSVKELSIYDDTYDNEDVTEKLNDNDVHNCIIKGHK